VAHAEEASILDALHRHSGHRGKTAAELGISVTTLWRRLRRISGAPAFAMIESHP
jgi:transcriptional regulator of acetoin/glycerol metabolism